MKHLILTSSLSLLIFISTISSAFSQDKVLEVSRSGKGKTRTFKAGQTMKIKSTSNPEEYSKVRLETITDSLLTFTVLDEETAMIMDVKPSDITSIKKPTCIHSVGYAVGTVFILGGAFTAASAPSIAGYDTATDGEVAAVRVSGLVAVGLGVVPFFIKQAEYSVSEGWSIKVTNQVK